MFIYIYMYIYIYICLYIYIYIPNKIVKSISAKTFNLSGIVLSESEIKVLVKG